MKGCVGVVVLGCLIAAFVLGWVLAYYLGTDKP